MSSLDVLTKLKSTSKKLERLKEQQSTLRGKRDGLLSTMKSRFGVSTVEEAKKLLIKKEEQLDECEKSASELEKKMNEVIQKCENQ